MGHVTGSPETRLSESSHHSWSSFLTIMRLLEFSGWDVADRLQQASWLNQSTHSSVANSTCSTLRQGSWRRITSVLNRPIGLRQGVVVRVADTAHRRFDTGLEQTLGVADREILTPAVAVVHEPISRGTSMQGLLRIEGAGHATLTVRGASTHDHA